MRYWFDRLMTKGTIALVGMLFLVTALVVIVTGILGNICNGESSVGNAVWQSLMHAIDAGTIAGDSTVNIPFLFLMGIVTLCGIFVTSILIGIISSGFEDKLNSLRKGFSIVVEENHTVVIGFDDSIYTILNELIEANANKKRGCILIIGDQDKEFMDSEIRNHIEDFKTTEIICRSGNFADTMLLEMASIETARSIIINLDDDFKVIKSLLATVAYLKKKNVFENDSHIVTLIHNEENLEAAKIAGEGKAEILFLTDVLARIIAHTCRQSGMSSVLQEFFDFDGDEFYFEEFPELEGHTFGEILIWFRKSVAVGIYRNGSSMLNPPMDTVIEKDDKIIHLAADDRVSFPKAVGPKFNMELKNEVKIQSKPYNLLILGYNDSVPIIIKELEEYVVKGSTVTLTCSELNKDAELNYNLCNITFNVKKCNICSKEVLNELLSSGIEDVLLLSDDTANQEDVDNMTILILLQLRDISSKMNINLNITSEMKSIENQRLCKVAKVNDFVVGNTMANLIMTQVSENRNLAALFNELLNSEGSELYMKPAFSYIKTGKVIDMYTLTEIVKERNEILIGYKKKKGAEVSIITNPDKEQTEVFSEEDLLIVISEE